MVRPWTVKQASKLREWSSSVTDRRPCETRQTTQLQNILEPKQQRCKVHHCKTYARKFGWAGGFFPSSSSFTVWTLTTTAIDSLPHSPWFRWCTSSLSAAVTCKSLAWAKWINKQYRNVLPTRKLPFSQSRSLCVIKELHTCIYTCSQKCGHNSHGCFILYLYYFLHCRYILETSNIWERYME